MAASGPALLLAALLASAQTDDPAAREREARDPGPRAPVAGLAGFIANSRVVFATVPDRPHLLDVSYAFPDRARIELLEPESDMHRIDMRFGTHCYVIQSEEGKSVEFEGFDRDAALRGFELRRAAMLWPDGCDWKPVGPAGHEDEAREARLPVAEGQPPLGTLRAECPAGKPVRIAVHDADGAFQESLEIRDWQEQAGRRWPREMHYVYGDQLLWKETVLGVETQVGFRDLYFVPPDRQPAEPPPTDAERDLMEVLLIETTSRTFPLEPGIGWEAATARALELQRDQTRRLEELGLRLEGWPAIALDDDRQPRGIVLRLLPSELPPPEGWETRRRRHALSVVVKGPEAVVPELVARLRAAAPKRTRPARLLLRPLGKVGWSGPLLLLQTFEEV